MNNDNGTLTVRDQQNRNVDSSEQYAINTLGDGAIKSADRLLKAGERIAKSRADPAHNKPPAGKRGKPRPTESTSAPGGPLHTQREDIRRAPGMVVDSTPQNEIQAVSQPDLSTGFENTNEHPSVWREQPERQNESIAHPAEHRPIQEEKLPVQTDPLSTPYIPAETESRYTPHGKSPALAEDLPKRDFRLRQPRSQASAPRKQLLPESRQIREPYPDTETRLQGTSSDLHTKSADSSLHLNKEIQLDTWTNNPLTSGLQNQGAALAVAEDSGAALQTFHAAGQAAGSAGASAAANAAAPGVAAVIQVTEKAATKIKETVENIAASAPQNTSSIGALAALFLLPLLVIAAIAGALRGGGSARNVGLSDDVISLMPQISAACQANGIPEYAPLVAAVIMQESGGRVADVGGDVMQCAEGMGLPVGTPVSLEESINFGTGIIASNLQEAGAAGPTDIPRISLALQGYNFGNGYISWALARGGYSKENAHEFSEMQAAAHGWSGYGDIDYVDHVLRYYQTTAGGMGDASAIADGRFAYPFPGHTWDTYPGHNGIDISFSNCYGEPVYAVADGTVRYTQDGWTAADGVGGMWSFGNAVFVEHGDGWISAYGHLSALAVASGETVIQGQLVGYIGSTGNSTGPHLHLALYHDGDAGIGGQCFAEQAWPQYRG